MIYKLYIHLELRCPIKLTELTEEFRVTRDNVSYFIKMLAQLDSGAAFAVWFEQSGDPLLLSSGFVPVFLRKHIATCDFPGEVGDLNPCLPPLDLFMMNV